MGTWKSRGLRGSMLEDMVNVTNEKYRDSKMALITKVPTPIKPVNMDPATGRITLAFFEQKSTVDYIGVVQGIPVCFDAKECAKDNFPMQNIHEHQIKYMEEFEEQGGIAFFLLYFSKYETYYYLTLKEARYHFRQMEEDMKKHIKYDELDEEYFIPLEQNMYVNYLKILQKDLDYRNK